MNNKGFTLIELLATIVILGIIAIIAVPILITNYKTSQEKSEQIFLDNLSSVIADYITLNGSTLQYDSNCGLNSCTIEKCDINDNCTNVTIKKANKSLKDIIDNSNNRISAKDLINPNGKRECGTGNIVEIYLDDDYVYCHRVKLNCVDNQDQYVIDTCNFGA